MNKSKIRKRILKLRKLNFHKNLEINVNLISKILKMKKMKGKILGGYFPYNYEVDGIKVLEKFEKKKYLITLPKIKKNSKMDFFRWSSKDPLKINKFGIPEPFSKKIEYPDIIIVPLLAYDKHLNRIGYGGGYYDRYIAKISKMKKIISIGLAHSFQKVKKIPINKHDVKLDFIVTEKKN